METEILTGFRRLIPQRVCPLQAMSTRAEGDFLMKVLSAQQPVWVSVWGGLEGAAAKQTLCCRKPGTPRS